MYKKSAENFNTTTVLKNTKFAMRAENMYTNAHHSPVKNHVDSSGIKALGVLPRQIPSSIVTLHRCLFVSHHWGFIGYQFALVYQTDLCASPRSDKALNSLG